MTVWAFRVKAIRFEVEAYFQSMNIPGRLAKNMFSIDAGEMHILT
jgi:hypothetical protein